MVKRARNYLDAIRGVGFIMVIAPILWSIIIFTMELANVYNPASETPAEYGYTFGMFIFAGALMIIYASFLMGKEESMRKVEELEEAKRSHFR